MGALPTPGPPGALLARITRSRPSELTPDKAGDREGWGRGQHVHRFQREEALFPSVGDPPARGEAQTTETTVNPGAPFWRFPTPPVEAVPNLEPLHWLQLRLSLRFH